ncbi:hypothetical protein B0H19DRAFT_840656, partial [Mycena capillaripes]
MAELARNYHNDLQQDETERDLHQKNEDILRVLEDVGQILPATDMSLLEKEIEEEDVIKALKLSAKRKAPGMDGIPTEFWVALYELFLEASREESR